MDTLLALSDEPDPPHQQVVKAISSFSVFLTHLVRLVKQMEEGSLGEEVLGWLPSALSGYLIAFKLGAKMAWGSEGDEVLSQTLKDSIDGALITYKHLSRSEDHHLDPRKREDVLDKARKCLLASIFPPLSASGKDLHDHLVPLFERARHLIARIQEEIRPGGASYPYARTPSARVSAITDPGILHIISLLHSYAAGIERIEVLSGNTPSRTRAEKDADKQRPLRIAIEARLLSCELAICMANRDIEHIKTRARKALLARRGDNVEGVRPESSAERTEDLTVKWEDKVEEEIMSTIKMARNLLREGRGAVLTDKLKRHDWLGDILRDKDSTTPWLNKWNNGISMVRGESEEESDSQDDDDNVEGSYSCPLSTLVLLHHRFQEQRLAVFMALRLSDFSGIRAYRRGEGGKVGEAWDATGSLLIAEYDR